MTHVFLDLDGTLTDPKPGITGAAIHALRSIGLDAPHADALEWMIGPPLLESFVRLGAPDPQQALDIYRSKYQTDGLFDATVYNGIPAALGKIAGAGHAQYLATAKPHVYATKITAHFGLDRHMVAQFGPELDGTRNNKGELLLFALDQLSLDAKDCVMVGDRSNDLNAARKSGMRFIGATWGYGGDDELAGADAFCARPTDLPRIIDDLSA